MNRIIVFLLTIFISQALMASDKQFKYKVINNDLEVFGYRLPTNHLPKNDGSHYVEFSKSPDSRYVVILSYLHLSGKYDAWLYDVKSKAKPVHINATHSGRHPELKWISNDIFMLAWAGMGYYTAGIYQVGDVNNGLILEDPVVLDEKRKIYISYSEDVLKTGIVVGGLFSDKNDKEEFEFKLPESLSVMDRYESIESVQIVGNKIVVKYIENGDSKEYVFYPKILNQSTNNSL